MRMRAQDWRGKGTVNSGPFNDPYRWTLLNSDQSVLSILTIQNISKIRNIVLDSVRHIPLVIG
jgi:hypothetical protein